MSQQVLISAELQKEREMLAASVELVFSLILKKKALEEDVKQALATIQKMQEITQKEQGHKKTLEEQLAGILRQKARVEELKAAVEVELKRLMTKSEKASIAAEAKVLSFKQKVENLESAVGRVKEEAHSSENKVWQVIDELSSAGDLLEKKASFTRYVFPAALVSTGALAVTGVVTYLRQKQSAQ